MADTPVTTAPTQATDPHRAPGWNWAHLALLAGLPGVALLHARLGWSPTATLLLWLGVNLAVLLAAERRWPYRAAWRADRGELGRDVGFLGLNSVADGLADVAILGLAVLLAPAAGNWPLWAEVAGGAAVAELGAYWVHRASHRGGWLWRVHVVHHLPEKVNAANSFTAHPLNAFYNKLARTLPLWALGLSADAVLAIGLFALTQGLAVHANVRGGLGWLERVLGSAGMHRLHHSTDLAQAGNYGTTLPLWDQVFGTWRAPAPVADVGVVDPARWPSARSLPGLLALPFRRTQAAGAVARPARST